MQALIRTYSDSGLGEVEVLRDETGSGVRGTPKEACREASADTWNVVEFSGIEREIMTDRHPQIGQVSALVPQVFYDIIGRIVPGFVLLVLGILLFMPKSWHIEPGGINIGGVRMPYGVLFWMGGLLSYFIGIVLGSFGYLIDGQEWRDRLVPDRQGSFLRCITGFTGRLLGRKKGTHKKPRPMRVRYPISATAKLEGCLSYVYDVIQLLEPAAGARLVKLSAERNMCRVWMHGSVLLLIASIVTWGNRQDTMNVFVVIFLPWSILMSGIFHRHLQIRSQHMMLNLWHIFVMQNRVRLSAKGEIEFIGQ
jgi:hypothetical protein